MDKEVLIQKTIKEHIDFQIRLLSIAIAIGILGIAATYLIETNALIAAFFRGFLMAAILMSALLQKKIIIAITVGILIPAIAFIFDTQLGLLMSFTTIINVPCGLFLPKIVEKAFRDMYENN